jgi:putative transposase
MSPLATLAAMSNERIGPDFLIGYITVLYPKRQCHQNCIHCYSSDGAKTANIVFNTDQGVQFTAIDFASELEAAEVRISMDGRGRFLDNIFVERLWRSVKYEDIYLKEYETVPLLTAGLGDYFNLYNYERPHQSLGYLTPADVHFAVNVPIL